MPDPLAACRASFPRRIPARFDWHALLVSVLGFLTLVTSPTAAAAQRQTLRRVAGDFVSPLIVTSLDPQRLLVADQIGVVHVLGPDGQRVPTPFLDLRPKLTKLNSGFDERGLLGLALHPDFARNGRLFVYYSAPRQASCPTNWDHTAHLAEFTARSDRSTVDPDSEKILLRIDQPYFNHNGGRVVFGADGHLYLALGDGGNAHDQGHDRSPVGNGQDLTTLLGKILRLDVDRLDSGKAYSVPPDNPLVGRAGTRPEIFAWGIRNPWGVSVDRGGRRQMFAADVGQSRYEEINIIRSGANYGWNQREGFHPFDPKEPGRLVDKETMTPSDREAFVDPILEYKNLNAFPNDPEARGISVTGGYVYRGTALPHLHGRYVFADWSRQWAVADGRLLLASPPPEGAPGRWTLDTLPIEAHPDGKIGAYICALGEDAAGELYVLTTQRSGLVDRTGSVWKLVPAAP